MLSIGEKEFSRLLTAIKWSNKQLDYARKKRLEAIKLLVGHHYAESGTQKREPVNFIKLAVDVYVRSLAARAPRVLISTQDSELKPTAANLELAVNQIPEEINLADTLRKWVAEALFSLGVVKVGLYTVSEIMGHNYGEPFVDVIPIDDYFCDMSATTWDQIQFEGNDYWPIYEEVMDSNVFDKKEKKDLKADTGSYGSSEGVTDRADSISVPRSREEYKDRIHLRDVWLPMDGKIITYAVSSDKILKEQKRNKNEPEPYHKLIFNDVPGNLLPLPHVGIWRDLHELANSLIRKIGNQADGQKSVLGFRDAADEEIANFKDAKDGDGIRYTGAPPEKMEAGGVDARTLAFYERVREYESYFAGNINALGGLAPQSATIGQDRLIGEAASAMLRDMAGRTKDAIQKVFKALCYYEWTNPVKTRNLEKSVPGFAEMKVPVTWNKKAKLGKFEDYNLEIDVYSMIDDSPSLKLQRLGIVLQQYLFPMMPEIQRQGGQLDIQYILELIAKYADFGELRDMVVFMEPGALGESQVRQQQYIGKPQQQQSALPQQTQGGEADLLKTLLSQQD